MTKHEYFEVWIQYKIGTRFNGSVICEATTEQFDTEEEAIDYIEYIKENQPYLVNWQITKYSTEVICQSENFEVIY